MEKSNIKEFKPKVKKTSKDQKSQEKQKKQALILI